MKLKIEAAKKQTFKLEIKANIARIKGSNYYGKMFSRTVCKDLVVAELKDLGYKEGSNDITADEIIKILEKKLTSNKKFAYKAIKKAIANGETVVDGLQTTSKERRSILSKLRKKEILDENYSLVKNGKSIEIVEKVSEDEEEEEVVW